MTTDLTISCPHCRRQYPIKVDPERLQRLKTRATCGRCGNAFDVAARVAAANAPPPANAPPRATEAKPMSPRALDARPLPPPMRGTLPSPLASTPSSSLAPSQTPLRLERIKPPAPPSGAGSSMEPDDMAELAREFADAAARFTPVKPRPPLAPAGSDANTAHTVRTSPVPPPIPPGTSGGPLSSMPSPSSLSASFSAPATASSLDELRLSEEPTSPTGPPVATLLPPAPTGGVLEGAATVAVAPVARPPAGSDEGDLSQLVLDDNGDSDFDAAENTMKRAKLAPPTPPSWIELADPGLDALAAPPSPTAALLDGILTQPGTPSASSAS